MPAESPSISRTISAHARIRPNDPAVTCDTTSTWSELDVASNRLARAYAELGVGRGDLVTIALPNSTEFVVAAAAVWKLGATPQPLNHRLPSRERDTIIELADSALVVGVEPGSIAGRRSIEIGFRPDPSLSDEPLADIISPSWKAPTSGGSTGRPKLILAAQPGVTDAARFGFMGEALRSTWVIPGPLHHNGPFAIAMQSLFRGDHIVVLPRFDAATTLDAIARHQATSVVLVPTMMHRIWRLPESQRSAYDLSSLRTVFHLAAPCPVWLKEAWIEWLGPDRITEIYAATEGHAATRIRGDEWLDHRGSVGRCTLGEITVVDPHTGVEAARGEIGEIVYRNREPTYRYVGAEAHRFNGGWEGLGDLGWMDDDGYLYLCDRRSDMILCGGANVYPAEVESAILEHPDVLSCAVIGLPDDELGSVVHAIVEAAPRDDLAAFVRQRLAAYKVPRTFEFVDGPVRDDAGKVRRTQLRAQRVAQ